MKYMTVPFSIRNGRVVSTTDPSVATESKIITTLTTMVGERVAIPTFGAGVSTLLFEPLDSLSSSDFRVDAMQELSARVSSADIMNMKIEPDPALGDNVARVSVVYRLPLSNPQLLSFKVVVPNTLTEESIF